MMSWLSSAEQDLRVAKHLEKTFYPKPLEIICYHCQQAAEKAVKAIIVYYGCPGGLPRSHDVSFLLSQIKNRCDISEDLYDSADTLSPYGVAVRYPSELFLEAKHASDAIIHSEKIYSWAASIIK